MQKSALLAIVLATFAGVAPTSAKIAGASLDGTWDCVDDNDAPVGAVVVANTSYAFLMPDGTVVGYGTLDRLEDPIYDLPVFMIRDGALKDTMQASALAMEGPRENTLDYSGELFMRITVTVDNRHFCIRRDQHAD